MLTSHSPRFCFPSPSEPIRVLARGTQVIKMLLILTLLPSNYIPSVWGLGWATSRGPVPWYWEGIGMEILRKATVGAGGKPPFLNDPCLASKA